MQITITIECSNDAFGNAPEVEVARILEELSENVSLYGIDDEPIQDICGNVVGRMEVSDI